MIDIIIFWIMLTVTSILAWKYVFLDHEFMHVLEYFRQGSSKGGIEFKCHNRIPSMQCWGNFSKNKNLIDLSGGLYSGLQAILIGLFGWYTGQLWLEIPFMTVGITNVVYSVFEMRYLSKWTYSKYMKWHYAVYVATIGTILFCYLLRELI